MADTPGPIYGGTVQTGNLSTGNVLAIRRVIDMDEMIHQLEPDASPLVHLTAKLGKKVAINPKYDWMEDEGDPRWDTANAAASTAASATALVVAHGNFWAPQDIIKVPRTGEVIEVTAVSSNTLTVRRAIGSTSAAQIQASDPLQNIGNANEEGAGLRTIRNTTILDKFNYCQIFRLPYGVTNTEMESELYGGPDLALMRKKKAIMFKQDMERAFLFGERSEYTGGTNPKRTTAGLNSYITTNVTAAGGTLTETTWETFLRSIFRYGSSKRVVFASPLVMSAISGFARSKIQYPRPGDGEETYGINVTKYVSPHGQVALVRDVLLEGTVWGGYAFACEMEDMKMRPLRNRDVKLLTGRQANDIDGTQEEYLAEVGFQLVHERKFGKLTGVTG